MKRERNKNWSVSKDATSGDSLIIWIDAISRKQRRVETAMDGKPVRTVSEFQDIAQDGPTYMAQSDINYDGASVESQRILITHVWISKAKS